MIKASAAPLPVSAITTSIDDETGGVRITWAAPYSNSDTVSQYLVQIQDTNQVSWYSELINCDGSSVQIIQSRSCLIPMATLRGAPFSLAFGQVVKVKISSRNVNGWSLPTQSSVNGATIRTQPTVMTALTRGSQTTEL